MHTIPEVTLFLDQRTTTKVEKPIVVQIRRSYVETRPLVWPTQWGSMIIQSRNHTLLDSTTGENNSPVCNGCTEVQHEGPRHPRLGLPRAATRTLYARVAMQKITSIQLARACCVAVALDPLAEVQSTNISQALDFQEYLMRQGHESQAC